MYPNLTEEQKADVKQRIASFQKDYIELSKKHDVDFSSYPQFVQNERGSFEVISAMTIVDKKYLPVPTPFDDKGDIIKK